MRIKETKIADGFGGVRQTFTRVVDLPEGEEAPEGAEAVAEDTPLRDWEYTGEAK